MSSSENQTHRYILRYNKSDTDLILSLLDEKEALFILMKEREEYEEYDHDQAIHYRISSHHPNVQKTFQLVTCGYKDQEG